MNSAIPKVFANRFFLETLFFEKPNCYVYAASDARLANRVVLVKVFKTRPNGELRWSRLFWEQMQVFQRASHPSLCPIIQFGEEKGFFFYAMECLFGSTIEQFINNEGLIVDYDRIFDYGLDLALGLKELHDLGLVHGHIDPRCLIFKKDTLCLAGFYPPMLYDLPSSVDSQRIFFDPHFCIPELFSERAFVDKTADTFALSGVLFYLLTGETPFSSSDPLVRKKEKPKIVHKGMKVVSRAISDFLIHGLMLDRKKRFQNMDEFIDAINLLRGNIKNPLYAKKRFENNFKKSGRNDLTLTSHELLCILSVYKSGIDLNSLEKKFFDELGKKGDRGSYWDYVLMGRLEDLLILVESSGKVLAEKIHLVDSSFGRLRRQFSAKSLKPGEAMLVSYFPQFFTFFQGRPIDLIFCTKDGIVLDTAQELLPWQRSNSFSGAAYIVLLPGGMLNKVGVFTGDRLVFDRTGDFLDSSI